MNKRILFLSLLAFILFRVLYLDRDLPPGENTRFGQKDEQAYNFTALNLYHFGSLSKPVADRYVIQGSIKFILNNSFTYASLVIFGNNYYGLRIGAVLASVLVFLLIFHLLGLDAAAIAEKDKKFIQFLVYMSLLLDFGFMVASRNAAPTIFRCLYLLLVMAYVDYLTKLPWRKQWFHFYLLGIACSLLIFFSYLTNAFILAGVFLFIVVKGFLEREIKKTLAALSLLLAGALTGAILANWVYGFFGNTGIRTSVANTFTVYSSRVTSLQRGVSSGSFLAVLIRSGIRKTVSLLSSNLFLLNFTFLFFVILSWGNTLYLVAKRKLPNCVQLLSFTLILAYAIQAFFYNPDSSKWIVLMLPVFLISVVLNVIGSHENWRRGILPGNGMGIVIRWGFLSLAGVLLVFRLFYVGLSAEFQGLVVLSFVIMLAAMVAWHGKRFLLNKKALPVVLLLTLLPNAILSIKYSIVKPEFHYRDACIAIDKIVGDKRMAGVWTDGFRLYTQGNAFFPWYQVQHRERHIKGLFEIFERELADFTVDFPSGDFFDVERDIGDKGRNFRLQRVASFYLGKGALGQSIWLYKRIDKNDQDKQGRRP